MSKSGPGAKPLPTNKKSTAEYMTPPTLAGKSGVESMGVPKAEEKDLSKRSSTKKIDESPEKIFTYSLNKSNMSKSLFEKLFEDVMDGADFNDLQDSNQSAPSDEEALGIEGLEETKQVTLTLDLDVAKQLLDVISVAVEDAEGEEGEEEDQGMGDDLGGFEKDEKGEEFGEEGEEDNAFGEGIEIVAEPQKLSTSYKDGKNNKEIHGSKLNKTQGGNAQGGSIPEPKGNPQALGDKSKTLQNKSNKVASFKSKGSLFDL